MKIGDILNVQGKGWIGEVIRWFTKSKYSHTACYIGDGKIVESDFGGVMISSVKKYDGKFDVFRHRFATETQLADAVLWMKGQVGKGYDYLGLIGVGLAIIGRKGRNCFDDKNRYWCSELVADGYINSGIVLCVDPDTYKVSPQDLADCGFLTKIE